MARFNHVLSITGILFLAIGALLLLSPAIAQDSPDVANGEVLFQTVCAVCHGPQALGVTGLGKNLVTSEFVAGLSDEELLAFVRTGRPIDDSLNTTGVAMPASGGRPDLSDADLLDIIAYVRGLEMPSGTADAGDTSGEFLAELDLSIPPESQVTAFAEPPRSRTVEEAALGRYLFYDTRLSADSSISCSTCHQAENAWTDGQELSDGFTSLSYFRNTPTLMNTAYYDVLYWDGRLGGGDMATVVRDHIVEAHFMASDGRLMTERLRQVPEYMWAFTEVYGSGPSFGKTLNALTAYVWSLNSAPSPYDSATLSEDAQNGLALFAISGCASCHNGPAFTDSQLYVSGVPENSDIFTTPERLITYRRFIRQFAVGNHRTLDEDVGGYILNHDDDMWGSFRTPTLRELCYTAPYMHNGTLASLDDVLAFYNDNQSLNLSDQDQSDMVAFLESLCSDLPETTAPELPGYGLRELGDNQ